MAEVWRGKVAETKAKRHSYEGRETRAKSRRMERQDKGKDKTKGKTRRRRRRRQRLTKAKRRLRQREELCRRDDDEKTNRGNTQENDKDKVAKITRESNKDEGKEAKIKMRR